MSYGLIFFLFFAVILIGAGLTLVVSVARKLEDNPADIPSDNGDDKEDPQPITWPVEIAQKIEDNNKKISNFLGRLYQEIVEIGTEGKVFSKAQNEYIPARVVHVCRNGSVIVDTPRGLIRKRRIKL